MKTGKLQNIKLVWVFTITMPAFMAALFIARFNHQIQFQIFILATGVYLLTALLHHFRDKTLTLEIIIEYVLIAALALVILQGLLL